MSLKGEEALILSESYTDEALEGAGALKGEDGKSAYQIWLDNGNVGTEQDFLDSLKGDGADGFSPVITENSNNTDEDYRLDIETKESKFTTPNLKADIRKNIAEHNTSTDSHNDIRIFLNELNNRLNALANSDDETLDEMKEVVAYIKDNRSLIESITTTKVNVADIIDNLTTNVSNKPLSASQGVVIKNLIDALQSELTAHINNFDIHVTASDKTNWNNATDKINNLKVGGRNLVLKSLISGQNAQAIDGKMHINITNVDTFFYLVAATDIEAGEYTLSFDCEGVPESVQEGALLWTWSIKNTTFNIKLSNGKVIVTGEINDNYAAGTAILIDDVMRNYITLYEGTIILSNFKLEKGNVATDWTPALEDKIEIADVNGLQTIADNNQFVEIDVSNIGWYRIASYLAGDMGSVIGGSSNSCEIVIKRGFSNTPNEEHRLLLKSIYNNQRFVAISTNSYTEDSHIIKKIRYVYDNSSRAYIDVYYNANNIGNRIVFLLNDAKDIGSKNWELVNSPYLVEESVEGETISTVFDIPTNANPVTDLDLTIDAIQGLRAELDELRSLITNS